MIKFADIPSPRVRVREKPAGVKWPEGGFPVNIPPPQPATKLAAAREALAEAAAKPAKAARAKKPARGPAKGRKKAKAAP